MATVHQPGPRLHRARSDEDRRRPYVLDEEQFGLALTRERYRSDRSRRPFGLLVVTIADEPSPNSSRVWAAAIRALTAATRDTDVAGWLEWPVAVGVIVPEITVDPLAACRAIQARVRRELATWMDGGAVGRVSIRPHVYPEPRRGGEEEPWSVDPLLYPELRARRERRTAYDAIKRSLDIIGSGALLLLLSPLLLVIAALVKTGSRGPVFFRQQRIGQMMKPFRM
ncbi:MAG TPA: sugar transferase, partial [Candidatus Methylomirabilis sp.]|nr:sugar transferase [Candidatus Methylomirabilis sp.]